MVIEPILMIPGPTNVHWRVLQAMARPIVNHRGEEFHRLYDEMQEDLKYAFRTKGDVLPLTASGTGAAECAISNFVKEGGKVLVPINGEFAERIAISVERMGAKPLRLDIPYGRAPTAENVKQAIDLNDDIDSLFLVHNETSTGVTARDLKEMAELCRREGILVVVDAISDLCGEEIENDDWGVNVCFTASQKCLAAPPGLSLISVDEEAWKRVEGRKAESKSFYFDLARIRKYHERSEIPFTPAVPLFYALGEALKLLKEEGYEARLERHRTCGQALYSGLDALGLKAYPMDARHRSNTVIVLKVPEGIDNNRLRGYMKEKHGVVISDGMGKLRGSTFRIGCMGNVSRREIALTISALEGALHLQGWSIEAGRAADALSSAFEGR